MPEKQHPASKRWKRLAKQWLPPILYRRLRRLQYHWRPATLTYAPDGWDTRLPAGESGWSVAQVVADEEAKWDAFCRHLSGPGPLGFSHESDDLSITRDPRFHNVHISFAYVLALTARHQDQISILDYGGGLGHYYRLGQAVLPGVQLDYHIKEVPLLAQAGQQLNPAVHWYDDDRCFDRPYDLVMFNGSTPYLPDWQAVLHRAAASARRYLFLTRQAIVTDTPSFVAIQRHYGSAMLHQQLNQQALLDTMAATGLRLVREFVVADRPYIHNAPESCELRGWLFANPDPQQ